MDDKRTEYLNYVRLLYEREASKGKQSGLTRWGVVIAIVYIAWNLIGAYPKIIDDQLLIQTTILLYGFMLLSIDFLKDLISISSGINTSSKYSSRITGTGFINSFSFLPTIFLLGVFPFLSQMRIGNVIQAASRWNQYGLYIAAQTKINLSIVGIFVIGTIIFAIASWIYEIKKGYPFPITFMVMEKKSPRRERLLFAFVAIEMGFGNAIAAYLTVNLLPSNSIANVLTFSLDIALLSFAINFLFRSQSESDRIAKINELERDIVFHDIPVDEIRNRLQEDFLGHELGEWLRNRVNQVRLEAVSLNQMSEKTKELRAALEALPQDLQYERSGRLDDYMTKLDSQFNTYNKKIRLLLDWLNIVISRSGTYKPNTIAILKEIFDDLKTINELTTTKSRTAIAELKEIIQTTKKLLPKQ
jgi:hypothetical protein